jgi:hypothetical protein
MDKDAKIDHTQVNEDEAVLAFSYAMPGNDGEAQKVEVDTKAAEANAVAEKELLKLNSDDSTQALAMLAEDQ